MLRIFRYCRSRVLKKPFRGDEEYMETEFCVDSSFLSCGDIYIEWMEIF